MKPSYLIINNKLWVGTKQKKVMKNIHKLSKHTDGVLFFNWSNRREHGDAHVWQGFKTIRGQWIGDVIGELATSPKKSGSKYQTLVTENRLTNHETKEYRANILLVDSSTFQRNIDKIVETSVLRQWDRAYSRGSGNTFWNLGVSSSTQHDTASAYIWL